MKCHKIDMGCQENSQISGKRTILAVKQQMLTAVQ